MRDGRVLELPRLSTGLVLLLAHSVTFLGTSFAAHNLWVGRFGFAELVWLPAFFGLWIFNVWCDGGPLKTATKLFEHFAEQRYARIRECQEDPILTMGYRILGFEVRTFEVSAWGIESLNWSAGQASHRLGKDVDDWSVFGWVSSNQVKSDSRWGCSEKTYLAIGSDLARERAERIAMEFAEFLKDAGVTVALAPPDPNVISKLWPQPSPKTPAET